MLVPFSDLASACVVRDSLDCDLGHPLENRTLFQRVPDSQYSGGGVGGVPPEDAPEAQCPPPPLPLPHLIHTSEAEDPDNAESQPPSPPV